MADSAARIDFDEAAAPATPAAAQVRLYAKADGLLYSKDDAGTETLVSGGAAGSTNLAGSELAYAEFTTAITLAGTTEATATSIVSAGAVSFDGSTIVMIECYIPSMVNNNSTSNARFWLYDGASSIGEIGRTTNPAAAAAAVGQPVPLKHRLMPSNGSHTYSIRGSSPGGASAGAGAGGAGNLMPGFIRITQV